MNTRPTPQMSELEIKTNLCYYDPRNQSDNLGADEDEDYPQPRNECSCDNCFYGRDKLAMQLLQAREQRDRLAEALEQLMSYQPRATIITTNEHHVWSNAKDALRSLNQPTEL
jgi:uncharacterized protein (DUF1499 family)